MRDDYDYEWFVKCSTEELLVLVAALTRYEAHFRDVEQKEEYAERAGAIRDRIIDMVERTAGVGRPK